MNGNTRSEQMTEGYSNVATVTITNQDRGNEFDVVAVEEARYDPDSYVVAVYDGTMTIAGTSEIVDAGEVFTGEVSLEEPLTETQTMTVVLHDVDDGEPDDPLEVNDIVVLDNATVGDLSFGEVR